MKINAPFNKQQVTALKKWQICGWVHEFTCCDHITMKVSTKGFTCPKCKLVQTWCHDFMLDPDRFKPKWHTE